jgi:cysteine desulfurase/selenocysteine lyase
MKTLAYQLIYLLSLLLQDTRKIQTIMELSIEKSRSETPGCQNVLHFNNAGAALSTSDVTNAVKEHIDLELIIGPYEAAKININKTEKIYTAAASLINCKPSEIAFLENATRAWDMAFYSLQFKKGDRILTSRCEYGSNYLAFLQMAKRAGVTIQVINDDHTGQIDITHLEKNIDNHVKLIAITHIPMQSGLINPAAEIGKIANNHNILYLLDATQSIGQMPVDVQEIGCDFLSATGRKYLRAPRGTGFLYARQTSIEKCDPPFIDLHSADWTGDNEYTLHPSAQRFETWEQNLAAKIGLGVAIEYANKLGMSAIWNRIQKLADQLRTQLATIAAVELHDKGHKKCGIITFSARHKSVPEIHQALEKLKINTSIILQKNARLDMGNRNIPALLRASVHYYNTEEEVNHFCIALQSLLSAD